jgi:uncharacterized protein YfaT (DUF1175 family)
VSDANSNECQPCENFQPGECQFTDRGDPHQCQRCGGTVRFCANCNIDHHDGGWNTCNATDAAMANCRHPACKAVAP